MSIAVRCPEVAGASTPTDLVESWVMNVVRHSLVVFELASGDYKSAFTLASASSLDDDLASEVSVADVVEAAVRSGHHAYAAATLAACSERLGEPTTPLSIGLVHRSHALVADDSRAEALYLQAIDALERATFPGQLARTRLLYGEWLRRRGRRVASRGTASGGDQDIHRPRCRDLHRSSASGARGDERTHSRACQRPP